MTDEGYVCRCCGFYSHSFDDEKDYDCPYKDEHGEHDLSMVWSTEKD